MLTIQNVLCPVDFTQISESEIQLAREVCVRFGARLILQHNVESTPPEFLGVGWMWSETHPAAEDVDAEAAARMREAMKDLDDITVEGRITRGPIDEAIPRLAREIPADLIVMATHDDASPEHTSTTESILRRAICPVLTIHRGKDDESCKVHFPTTTDRTHRVLAAVGFTRRGRGVLHQALALAHRLPIELHLIHVEHSRSWSDLRDLPSGHMDRHRQQRLASAHERLQSLIPLKLRSRVHVHVSVGSISDQILELSQELDASLLITGVPGTRRTWLFRSTSLGLLHGSPCPVWYVPNVRRVARDIPLSQKQIREAVS